jgi:hypothetical protein
MARVEARWSGAKEALGLVVVILVRAVALWVLIPLVFVVWAALAPLRWLRYGSSRPRFRQYLTWADLTFVASLERGPLRPLVRAPEPFPTWPRKRQEPPYRVSWRDLL